MWQIECVVVIPILVVFGGIQCSLTPFRYHRLNILETLCLVSLIIVLSDSISRASNQSVFAQFYFFICHFISISIHALLHCERGQKLLQCILNLATWRCAIMLVILMLYINSEIRDPATFRIKSSSNWLFKRVFN